jgi:hypothetical protein
LCPHGNHGSVYRARGGAQFAFVVSVLLLCLVLFQQQTIEMRSVDLHVSDAVLLHVRDLRAVILPTRADQPPSLDSPTSYRIRVLSGTLAMTTDALTPFLNDAVFNYKGSPLKNLSVTTDSTGIVVTGTLHKVVDIGFRMRGDVSVTPDGQIRIHPTKMTDQKLLHTLGLHMSDLVDVQHARGLTLDKDDIIINANAALSPPTVEGRIAQVHVQGNALVERFAGDSASGPARDSTAPGFVKIHGGRLAFGRLLMTNTDVVIVGPNPHGVFELSLPRYAAQVVTGYTVTTPSMGLIVHAGRYVSPNVAH